MPIVMQLLRENNRDIYGPTVICDQCGEPIEDAKKGNTEFRVNENGAPVDGVIVFLHKACSRAFEDAHGGRVHWFFDELTLFPVYLATGLRVNWREAREWARNQP